MFSRSVSFTQVDFQPFLFPRATWLFCFLALLVMKRPASVALQKRRVLKRPAIALPGKPCAIVPCSASANPTLGEVRRNYGGSGWLARFAFKVKGERSALNGPLRSNHEDAESDRQIVASSIAQLNRSLKPDAAFRALERLHASSTPCSASVVSKVGQVRRTQFKSGWHARFQFRVRGERVAFNGPSREAREIAETDRANVAALIAPLQRSLKPAVADRALRNLFPCP